VMAQVVRTVGGRVGVSAALGELVEFDTMGGIGGGGGLDGLAFVKLGLAGCGGAKDWTSKLDGVRSSVAAGASWVAVAYADWRRADAPSVEDVLEYAIECRCAVVLIDTFVKDGQLLTGWLGVDDISAIVSRAHDRGVRVALAGSLRVEDLGELVRTGADVLAVRSAACGGRDRCGAIDSAAVRGLKAAIQGAGDAAIATRPTRRAG
jgi:hypothetical protein